MPFIRSISGLRATLGDALSPAIVAEYAAAFSSILPAGPIVIGRDGRPSGIWITGVVLATLQACGREVRVLGMVPTPTVQLLTEHSDAVGGISITASHNPDPWNGLKFIDASGVFLDATGNARLWHAVDGHTTAAAVATSAGSHVAMPDALRTHLDAILAMPAVKGAPSAGGETVVVDAVNCSGSVVVPALLREMGYTVVELYCDGSGVFPHTPEPVSENLHALANAVREHGAVMGIAVDPDADRLVLLDEHGSPIGEEYTITLATEAVLGAGTRGPVVVNYSTTRMVDDVAARYDCTTFRASVGEINVVRRMQQEHAVIGGEGSGGVIDPSVHYGRDSLVGIGLITALLRSRRQTLGQAVLGIPRYTMIKTKQELQAGMDVAAVFDRVVAGMPDATISREDGVHMSWSDQWVHIRASNTEPIIRIIAEAPLPAMAAALIERVRTIVGAP